MLRPKSTNAVSWLLQQSVTGRAKCCTNCSSVAAAAYDGRRSGIKEMSNEAELQAIAAEAARALSAPVALVGVLNGDREIVKSIVGWQLDAIPLAASFAARIAEAGDVVIAGDAPRDPRFASHPMVVDAPHITFYAGAPIVDDTGRFLGAISVLDRTSH